MFNIRAMCVALICTTLLALFAAPGIAGPDGRIGVCHRSGDSWIALVTSLNAWNTSHVNHPEDCWFCPSGIPHVNCEDVRPGGRWCGDDAIALGPHPIEDIQCTPQ
jgi:hypothetical protein